MRNNVNDFKLTKAQRPTVRLCQYTVVILWLPKNLVRLHCVFTYLKKMFKNSFYVIFPPRRCVSGDDCAETKEYTRTEVKYDGFKALIFYGTFVSLRVFTTIWQNTRHSKNAYSLCSSSRANNNYYYLNTNAYKDRFDAVFF